MDSGINAAIAGAVAITGLVVILASVFSLAGVVFGGAMLIGGTLSAYSYAQQASDLASQLEKSSKNVLTAMDTMKNTMSTYEGIINNDTHKNFIVQGIVTPMLFGALTVVEQVCPNEEAAQKLEDARVQTNLLIASSFG
jgi:hypothetical protein